MIIKIIICLANETMKFTVTQPVQPIQQQFTVAAPIQQQFTVANIQPTQQQFTVAVPDQNILVAPGSVRSVHTASGPVQTINANDYKHLDHRTHIYTIPGMYCGNDVPTARQEWLLDLEAKKMTRHEISLPEAVERLYLEALSNACDNVIRSRRVNVDPKRIELTMDNRILRIKNYGLPVPIQINEKENMWAPDLIFGNLLTSSNYVEERFGAGVNGIGIKLLNIFSHTFEIHIHDSYNKAEYYQKWENNMLTRYDPIISFQEKGNEESSVEVTWYLDFERFQYTEYPPECYGLFTRHAADVSFTAKIPVYFNGVELDLRDIKDYAKLYFGEDAKKCITYYEWPQGLPLTKKGPKGQMFPENYGRIIPVTELCIVDCSDAEIISFVNGLMTKNGGVHVNAAVKTVTSAIVERLNNAVSKKGKKKDRKFTIDIRDVKPHISMILSCHLVNPKFDGQSKNTLQGPIPKFHIPEELLTPINNWNLYDRLNAVLDAKQYNALSKQDGKKKRRVGIRKLEDANEAGGPRSTECTLFWCEGDSASAYLRILVDQIPNGRDLVGILPGRGKVLNVTNANFQQIAESGPLDDLRKSLGLREGVDYQDDKVFETLRYGHFMVLSDEDDDGEHIRGLIFNFFHKRYPSLLARQFVKYYLTPIVRVWKGGERYRFFFHCDYVKWKNEHPNYRSWEHKYYKGLGSSTNKEIAEDFSDPHSVVCFYDIDAPNAFRLAFDVKMSNERKKWIEKWKEQENSSYQQLQPLSEFIDKQLVVYSVVNLRRSVPRLLDGLKESQRKALWGAMKKFGKKKTKGKLAKIGTVAEFASEYTHYHHDAKMLADTMVGMAHSFPGSNNMPYFVPEGQLGTRYKLGKDTAAHRYTSTRLQPWIKYVFLEEDMPLLKLLEDEGDPIEPVTLIPIIPMCLINGALGIGTGHSTFIANYNPLDILKWLRYKIELKGNPDPLYWQNEPEVIPWYRDWIGIIQIVDRSKKGKRRKDAAIQQLAQAVQIQQSSNPPPVNPLPAFTEIPPLPTVESVEENQASEENNEEEEAEDNDGILEPDTVGDTKYSMVTKGILEVENNGLVVITELPIGRSQHAYDLFLEGLEVSGAIKRKRNLCKNDKIRFELTGCRDISLENLRLIKSFGLSNMVLLDNDGRPHRYATVYDILDEFYTQRIRYYQPRKDNMMNELATEINLMTNKMKFILAVIRGELLVLNRPKSEILGRMAELAIPDEILNKVKVVHCTREEVERLSREIEKRYAEYQKIEATPIEQLWLNDLDEFEKFYTKWVKEL